MLSALGRIRCWCYRCSKRGLASILSDRTRWCWRFHDHFWRLMKLVVQGNTWIFKHLFTVLSIGSDSVVTIFRCLLWISELGDRLVIKPHILYNLSLLVHRLAGFSIWATLIALPPKYESSFNFVRLIHLLLIQIPLLFRLAYVCVTGIQLMPHHVVCVPRR